MRNRENIGVVVWTKRETDVHRLTANANLKHEQYVKGDLSLERFQALPAHILFVPNKSSRLQYPVALLLALRNVSVGDSSSVTQYVSHLVPLVPLGQLHELVVAWETCDIRGGSFCMKRGAADKSSSLG